MDATTPPVEDRREVRPAPGCPEFKGTDTVLNRPGNDRSQARKQAGTGVRPGLQKNGVVWWDPSALKLKAPSRDGLRGATLLSPKGKHAQSGRDEYRAFIDQGVVVRQRAQAPTVRARTTTAASQLEAPSGRPIAIVTTEASGSARPHGPRFGTLVHAVLGEAAFDADFADLNALASFHARALGASEEEREAAASAARSALDHPIMKRAAKSSDARREVMLVHKQVDGAVLEGVADLVFFEQDPFGGDKWVVVDFKTDLEQDVKPAYQVQIELYAAAVEAATGQPCEGVLLGV
jgi:ATP-dependent exoDNAse (exonuclease V) beta subunit